MEKHQEEGLNDIQKEIQKEKINSKISSIKNLFEKNPNNKESPQSGDNRSQNPIVISGDRVKHRVSVYTPQLKQCKFFNFY
jgi:hypothetical protein